MSSIVIKGNTSGQVEIAAPDVAGSTTLTLPTGTANLLTADGDGSQLTNLPQPAALSTATGSAPSYSARAWVFFNGTGTVSITNSANVSSITDAAIGRYVVNMTTALPATTYAIATNPGGDNAANRVMHETYDFTRTTSSFSVVTANMNGAETDTDSCSVVVFI